MKTFTVMEKQSAHAGRKTHPHAHHPMGPVQQAQQANISRILRSTGAQAKLTIGKPNDKYEQEADRVADQVMSMPDPRIQRQEENDEENELLVDISDSLDNIAETLRWMLNLMFATFTFAVCVGVVAIFFYLRLL